MTHLSHPDFSSWFSKFFLRAWLVIASLFGCSLFLLNKNYTTIGWFLAILFGISIPFTIGYLIYKLHHINCPRCYGRLKTIKSHERSQYVAVCDQCDIAWDTGIGSRSNG